MSDATIGIVGLKRIVDLALVRPDSNRRYLLESPRGTA
jgi:hypothetical protein